MTERELYVLSVIADMARMAYWCSEGKTFKDVCSEIKMQMNMADPDYYGLIGSAE